MFKLAVCSLYQQLPSRALQLGGLGLCILENKCVRTKSLFAFFISTFALSKLVIE